MCRKQLKGQETGNMSVVVVIVVVLTLTCIIKSVVTGQAPVTLELRNTVGKNTNNLTWYTHISQLTQFMPPPETYKSEIGSQSTMCQVHTGAYVSLLASVKTDYTACHPRKTTTYILHVASITTDTHDRRKSIGKKKQEQIRRERKGISGVYWRVCHQNGMSRGFSTAYSSITNDFRHTHRSTDYRPITRSTAGKTSRNKTNKKAEQETKRTSKKVQQRI